MRRSFWEHGDSKYAGKNFAAWDFGATYPHLAPLIEAARTLNRHIATLMASFTQWIIDTTAGDIIDKLHWPFNIATVIG
ncbi:MAG: hypothetical protein R3B74_05335 [Nitrospirales bacterium]|nr:hypothetical protein [Nitrospirales bacterium]